MLDSRQMGKPRSRTQAKQSRRPMAGCPRVSLFRREIKVRVSRAGFDLLLENARKISEGQITAGRYYGSTMLTLDLSALGSGISEPGDIATARRLAHLLGEEPELLQRLREVALSDARRIAHGGVAHLEADLRIRADGCSVLVDVDVEGETAPVAARSSRR
jgi:hypothetical protein